MSKEIALPTTDLPDGLPKRNKGDASILPDDKGEWERERRLVEQQGQRHWARVYARDHSEKPIGDDGVAYSPLQHPYLASQRFSGVDNALNPEPPLNTEARREYDNEKREQDKEKALRMANSPKFSSAPKPRMG